MLNLEPNAPAVLGGDAAVSDALPVWPPNDPQQRQAIIDVLETSQWWSKGGTAVSAFERRFAATHGAKHATACTNGTHALELALRSLNVGPGDDVIVPAMTFVATSMAVMLVGAKPVPVDVEPGTWCLDLEACRSAIGPRTRAIVPVHFAGHMADMHSLSVLARDAQLPVIEDAAHAHGASRGGVSAGSASQFAAFSFQNFKLMTAGEGGILLSNDDALGERARLISNCGRPDGDLRYQHKVLGSNMRMTEFQGAILNVQLDRLAERAALRSRRAHELCEALGMMNGIRLQTLACDVERHSWYMVVMELDEESFGGLQRDAIVEALVTEGVPAYQMYPLVQETPHFAKDFAKLGGDPCALPQTPVGKRLADHGIWLHHRVLLGSEALIEQIAKAFRKVAYHGGAIRARK